MTANAPKTRARTRKGKGSAGAKVTATKKAADVVQDADADAAAKAEEEARVAKLNADRAEFGKTLADKVEDVKAAESKDALEIRLKWVSVGQTLNEGKALFIGESSNQPNMVQYGKWLSEHGHKDLGSRPMLAAVSWMADTHDNNPDLYSLFPTEPEKVGAPMKRTPRALYGWVRDNVCDIFQTAFEEGSLDPVAKEDDNGEKIKDEDRKAAAAKRVQPVLEAYKETVEGFKANAEAAHKAIADAKNKDARAKATAAHDEAADVAAAAATRLSVYEATPSEQLVSFLYKWTPKVKAVSFKDLSVEDAAARAFALINQHEEVTAILEALEEMHKAAQAQVDADAGDIDVSDDDIDDSDDDFDGDDSDDDDAEPTGDADEDDFEEDEDDFEEDEDDFEEDAA